MKESPNILSVLMRLDVLLRNKNIKAVFSHSKDRVAGNCGIVGAINGDAMQDEDQGHKNKTFITTIQNLPEGRYRYINGRFVYTGSVQTQH